MKEAREQAAKFYRESCTHSENVPKDHRAYEDWKRERERLSSEYEKAKGRQREKAGESDKFSEERMKEIERLRELANSWKSVSETPDRAREEDRRADAPLDKACQDLAEFNELFGAN